MARPDVIHGTGGHLWIGDPDSPPPNAIPIKDWTMTLKPEYREDGPEDGLRRPGSIASMAGSFSGIATWAAVPRSGPGGRKAGRMRRRGY